MAKGTKRRGKDKVNDANDGKKKKKQLKLYSIDSGDDTMFEAMSPGKKYIDNLIVLSDGICGKNVPNAAKGKFFKYKVGKYGSDGKKFKLHYMDIRQLNQRAQIGLNSPPTRRTENKKVVLELVEESRELFLRAHGRIQKVKRDAEAATRKTIETIICDKEAVVCFNDIDESVKDHGAKSEEVSDLIFISFDKKWALN